LLSFLKNQFVPIYLIEKLKNFDCVTELALDMGNCAAFSSAAAIASLSVL